MLIMKDEILKDLGVEFPESYDNLFKENDVLL